MSTFNSLTIICIQYCIISFICTISLAYFIVVTGRSAEHSSELLFYKLAMGFSGLCAFTDIFFALREFCMISLGSGANYLSEILYSSASICGTYCWFVYSEKKQLSRISNSAKQLKLCAIPFAIMLLFTISTPLHNLCFSFSGINYVRGILNLPFTIACSVFVVVSGVKALITSFSKQYHSRTVLLRMLFLYSVVLILAQVVQVFLGPILPFRSLTATVVFMFITLRGMTETVTIDALSQINNRFSLDRVLDNKILSKDQFLLIMLDIDDFKSINDTYGHIYGDDAIRFASSAITRAVPHNYFVARFGGDEFAVVGPYDAEFNIEALNNKISDELNKIIQDNNCPFNIGISSGFAHIDGSINNIPDMLEAADKDLYKNKRNKKVGRNI